MSTKAYVLAMLVACGGQKHAAPPAAPATPPTATPTSPTATTTTLRTPTAFGRYTVIAPDGYEAEVREIEVGFRREGVLMLVLDGAEFHTPARDKCEGQLAAFATGVVTGLARAERAVTVASSKSLPNGCRLVGTTSGAPTALVEAALLDLGLQGPAIAFLIHTRADDGASNVFDEIVASIAKK